VTTTVEGDGVDVLQQDVVVLGDPPVLLNNPTSVTTYYSTVLQFINVLLNFRQFLSFLLFLSACSLACYEIIWFENINKNWF